MNNFLNWLDQSPSATIIGLCILFVIALFWQRKEYREQRKADALRVEELARERNNLLQCNMELQQTIYQREQWIKELSPYQIIQSKMLWGKN